MKHIRVFARVAPFWNPCILAKDLSDEEAGIWEGIDAAVNQFLPIINNVITLQVTDVAPAVPAVTPADSLTSDDTSV